MLEFEIRVSDDVENDYFQCMIMKIKAEVNQRIRSLEEKCSSIRDKRWDRSPRYLYYKKQNWYYIGQSDSNSRVNIYEK